MAGRGNRGPGLPCRLRLQVPDHGHARRRLSRSPRSPGKTYVGNDVAGLTGAGESITAVGGFVFDQNGQGVGSSNTSDVPGMTRLARSASSAPRLRRPPAARTATPAYSYSLDGDGFYFVSSTTTPPSSTLPPNVKYYLAVCDVPGVPLAYLPCALHRPQAGQQGVRGGELLRQQADPPRLLHPAHHEPAQSDDVQRPGRGPRPVGQRRHRQRDPDHAVHRCDDPGRDPHRHPDQDGPPTATPRSATSRSAATNPTNLGVYTLKARTRRPSRPSTGTPSDRLRQRVEHRPSIINP